jgi:8-oxo-dGTP diphosphatase
MHVAAKGRHLGDEGFLAGYDPGLYERPSVAVDVVVLTVAQGKLRCLLVRRAAPPQQGWWALPGGFVGFGEGLDRAAARVLEIKGGLPGAYVEQLYTFGDPGRDPRTRVITVAYIALVDAGRLADVPAEHHDDVVVASLDVAWPGERGGPVTARADGDVLPLAFDHADILGAAVKRLRGKLGYAPVGYELLPRSFTLRQLQDIHEAILGRALNKDSFRRRMLAGGQLRATGRREANVAYRPAELYRFVKTISPQGRKENNNG